MSPVLTLTFLINDTATPEIYTLSLHDALPIYERTPGSQSRRLACSARRRHRIPGPKGLEFRGRENSRRSPSRLERTDRKSTRLNSSHANISYAVFCLKKKKYGHQLDSYGS